MHPYAPKDRTSPGTDPDNPFVMRTVRQCYLLLNDLRIRIPDLKGDELVTQTRVSFERMGPVISRRFNQPVDHYILYIGSAETGKLMDFYMYGYGDTCMGQEHLPKRLFTIYWHEINADAPHRDSVTGQYADARPTHGRPVQTTTARGVELHNWLLSTIQTLSLPEIKTTRDKSQATEIREIAKLQELTREPDKLGQILAKGNLGFATLMTDVRSAHDELIKMETQGYPAIKVQSECYHLEEVMREMVLQSLAIGDSGAAIMFTKYLCDFSRCDNRQEFREFLHKVSESYKRGQKGDCRPRKYLCKPSQLAQEATEEQRKASCVLPFEKWQLCHHETGLGCGLIPSLILCYFFNQTLGIISFAAVYLYVVYLEVTMEVV